MGCDRVGWRRTGSRAWGERPRGTVSGAVGGGSRAWEAPRPPPAGSGGGCCGGPGQGGGGTQTIMELWISVNDLG